MGHATGWADSAVPGRAYGTLATVMNLLSIFEVYF